MTLAWKKLSNLLQQTAFELTIYYGYLTKASVAT